MKLNYKLLFLFVLFSVPTLQAQWQNGLWIEKQAYNWHFGDHAGLDFHTSPPSPIPDTAIGPALFYPEEGSGPGELDGPSIIEGTGAISDAAGNILFYTNGQTIWNANNEIMENGYGIFSDASSAQTGLIVPAPGNPDLYYVFTLNSNLGGAYYSEVDMSLYGGLGGVTENKNIQLTTDIPATTELVEERLSAVYHSDGKRVWVVIHTYNNSELRSFLVSEEGVNMTPVVTIDEGNAVGTMKLSPDGSKLALSRPWFDGTFAIDVFNFDRSTGTITDLVAKLDQNDVISSEIYGAQGLEFSPNSRFLYTSGFLGTGNIYQFDLEAGSEQAIKNSGITIGASLLAGHWTMQAAPDGKIYVTNMGNVEFFEPYVGTQSALDVINFPNNPGLASGYAANGQDLENGRNDYSIPVFIQSYFASGILHEGECEGTATTFSTLRIPGITAISWDFGDTASGDLNTSEEITPSHVFSAAGTYTVTALITSNNAQQTATSQVMILPLPAAVVPVAANRTGCDSGSGTATFDLEANNAEILGGQDATAFTVTHYANEADAEAEIPVSDPQAFTTAGQQVYTRVVNTNTGCSTLVSYALEVLTVEAASPGDLAPCGNQDGIATLDLTDYNEAILSGQDAAAFTVNYFNDAAMAESGNGAINAPQAYETDGETLYARVTNTAFGCYKTVPFEVSITIADLIPTSLDLIGCSPFNLTQSISEFDPSLAYTFYTDEPDALSGTAAITAPEAYLLTTEQGYVYVRAENAEGCFNVAELLLETGDCIIPKGISVNGDGLNDRFDLTFLTAGSGGGSLEVFNRYGMKVYERSDYTNQWAGQDSNGNELPSGTYYYVLNLQEANPDFGKVITSWVYVIGKN